jgi:hypothetical protein
MATHLDPEAPDVFAQDLDRVEDDLARRAAAAAPSDPGRSYDPTRDPPRTLGELHRYALCAAAARRGALSRIPVRLLPDQVPGLGRLLANCAAELGTTLTVEAVVMMRGRYCLALQIDSEQADRACLEEVARVLLPPGPPAPAANGLQAGPLAGAAIGCATVTGPVFSAADWQRAWDALDHALQDYSWQEGENRLLLHTIYGALRTRGLTLALIEAVVGQLLDAKAGRHWSHTDPAGHSWEPGYPGPVYRSEPETTHCLVTTRAQCFAFLAEQRRLAAGPATPQLAPPEPQPAASAGPTHDFLDFPPTQRKLLLALAGAQPVPIAALKKAVYGNEQVLNKRLEQLVVRTNRGLVERNDRREIKRHSNTFRLHAD